MGVGGLSVHHFPLFLIKRGVRQRQRPPSLRHGLRTYDEGPHSILTQPVKAKYGAKKLRVKRASKIKRKRSFRWDSASLIPVFTLIDGCANQTRLKKTLNAENSSEVELEGCRPSPALASQISHITQGVSLSSPAPPGEALKKHRRSRR